MTRLPTLKTAMTPFPWWVGIDEPLQVAREMMQAHKVRHLPVKDAGRLVSIITDRDIKFALDPELGLPPRSSMRVRDVCVYAPYVVDIATRLDIVLETMAQRRIGSAIVTREGKLVGIFTAADACRSFARLLHTMRGDDIGPEVA